MDKLKALLEELKSKGMATPVVISKEDWSLGSHYFGYLYITQSDDEGASAAYIDKMKKGEIDLKNDKRFQSAAGHLRSAPLLQHQRQGASGRQI